MFRKGSRCRGSGRAGKWVQFELREALRFKKNIILVHDADPGYAGYAEFSQ